MPTPALSTAAPHAIQVRIRNLTRRYGNVVALDDVSFAAAPGAVLGLLGPNGAGKSTAMKVITGFLAADQGTVEFVGRRGDADVGIEVHSAPIACRALVGWMPEVVPVYEDMEADAYLRFVAAARGLATETAEHRLETLAREIGLVPMLHKPIRELSRGYRQRVGLAQALIHDPPVLVMDEPTSGLDPTQIAGLHEFLRNLAVREGKTILFSSHILSEVEAVADSIVVIDRGRMVYEGTCEGLQATAAGAGVAIRFRLSVSSSRAAVMESFSRRIAELGGRVEAGESSSEALEVVRVVGVDADRVLSAFAASVTDAGAGLLHLSRVLPPLQDAFVSMIERGRRPDAASGDAEPRS